MKDCESRSCLGGEGNPSRDNISQGEERLESTTCGFQLIESRGKGSAIHRFLYNICVCVYGCQWR
jgi:hypothetical protein